MENRVSKFFKTLPNRLKEYFKKYFKNLNYPLYISFIIISILLFLSDILTKHAAFNFLTNGNINDLHIIAEREGTPIIPYILDMKFTQNNGAAWGSFSGQMWALTIVSFIATIMLTVNLLFRFSSFNKLVMVGVMLMLPGALGNLVDRMGCLTQSGIYQGGVIDFLHFTFWDSFPICNLADYYLSIGAVLLVTGTVIEVVREYKRLKQEELEEEKNASSEESIKEEEDMLEKLKEKEIEDERRENSDSKTES